MSLTLQAAALDLLSKLGIELSDPTTAPALAQQDVIIAINWAGQILQRAGQDFFTRTSVQIALVNGQQKYVVSAGTAAYSVQAVLGPVRLNNTVTLAALTSRGQLDQFDRIYLGQADYGAAQGTPICYYPEFVNNGQPTGNVEQLNIWFAPTPGNNPGSVTAEVVLGWTPFTVAEIGNTTELPVAMDYVESIFLPLARMAVTRSSQFSRESMLQSLMDDGNRALAELGTAGGFPNAVQGGPDRKTTG